MKRKMLTSQDEQEEVLYELNLNFIIYNNKLKGFKFNDTKQNKETN